VTGTFINRNIAAVYYGSCAIVCLLLLCKRVQNYLGSGPITWQKVQHRILDRSRPGLILSLAMLFLCLTAMFMTRSRAGVLLSLVALIGGFALYFRRDLPGRFGLLATLFGGAALATVLLQLMGGGVNARFDAQGVADEGRIATWRATLRLIADHPWFGTGEGTFVWSFPSYRSGDVSMQGVWDHAHNTLLEVAADMGIPFATFLFVVWIFIIAILFRAVWMRRRDRLVATCALSIAVLASTHSLIDFSLQIPGYSIPALALIGTGLARSLTTDRKASPITEPAATESLASTARNRPKQGAVNPAA
jgi:O-antigen ligase